MSTGRRSWLWRYGVAILAAVLALLLRFALDPWLGSHAPYLTYMVAVAVTVWLAGFGPALVTAAAGVPAALIFVIPGDESWLAKCIGVSIYATGMLTIALLGRGMRNARARAQAAERFRRGILDVLPLKIAVLDAAGRVLTVNQRWAELPIGTDYLQFSRQAAADGADASAVEALACLEAVLDGRRDETSLEYPCDTPTEKQWFLMRITRPPPEIGGAIVSHVEITRRKLAEEKLRATAAELERSNQDLEQFAYVASHDLREPLAVINMYMDLLKKRHGPALDASALEHINEAVDASKRMNQLISDLLTFSRVGRKTEGLVPTDAGEALERALRNLSATIEARGARITHDPLPTLVAEKPMLGRLLQNLLANAIKYCEDGVQPRIHVGARRNGQAWTLWVRDNGVGIAPDDCERVFLLFQRARPRGDRDGSGIGLAICKRIVEYHGGRIWVDSAPGEGSTFYFTIPDRV